MRLLITLILSDNPLLSLSVIGAMFYYFFCFNSLDNYEISINRNYISGQVVIDTTPGYKTSSPFTQVVRIDTRPMRLCIPSGSKNLTCKLVQFKKENCMDFIKTEGIWYYWLKNRLSFNSGHREEYRGFRDLMLGYTFDKQDWPFIKILTESE